MSLVKSSGPTSAAGIPKTYQLVADHLKRAEWQFGITRRDVYTALGVTSPALSAWSSDNDQCKIPMTRIAEFASIVRLSQTEKITLVLAHFHEKERGEGISFDPSLMMEVFEFLMPDEGQQQLLAAYQEVFEVLPWRLDAARLSAIK
jgi:hypothetical protein